MLLELADERITESSGIVTSSDGRLLFTHNDSGDSARFFAVDRSGRTRATYVLRGVQARDWEDISRGPGRTLWLGDIGDNRAIRDRGLLVHRVAEPSGASSATLPSTPYRLRYEDGPRDAEALIVTPRTGLVLVVEKTLGSSAGVYAADLPLRAGGAVNVLRRVAQVSVPSVTGGDISADGTRLVLRNYSAAYEWEVPDGDVVGALAKEPTRVQLPGSQQGEGIAYGAGAQSLITSTEGVRAPVHELRRGEAEAVQTPEMPDQAPSPGSRGNDWKVPLLTAGALLLIALVVGLTRHRSARSSLHRVPRR